MAVDTSEGVHSCNRVLWKHCTREVQKCSNGVVDDRELGPESEIKISGLFQKFPLGNSQRAVKMLGVFQLVFLDWRKLLYIGQNAEYLQRFSS